MILQNAVLFLVLLLLTQPEMTDGMVIFFLIWISDKTSFIWMFPKSRSLKQIFFFQISLFQTKIVYNLFFFFEFGFHPKIFIPCQP